MDFGEVVILCVIRAEARRPKKKKIRGIIIMYNEKNVEERASGLS